MNDEWMIESERVRKTLAVYFTQLTSPHLSRKPCHAALYLFNCLFQSYCKPTYITCGMEKHIQIHIHIPYANKHTHYLTLPYPPLLIIQIPLSSMNEKIAHVKKKSLPYLII